MTQPTIPELYAQAVERLECLTARLKAATAPESALLGLYATRGVKAACRAIEKAAIWIEQAEGEANL